MSELDNLLKKLPTLTNQMSYLQNKYDKTRLSDKQTRRNLMSRIRAAEKAYDEILKKIMKLDSTLGVGNSYRASQVKVKNGVVVTVEISTDGITFSNPGPTIPKNSTIYVRAVIDEAHTGTYGEPKTHEMCHLRWVLGKGYTRLDTIPSTGHAVYFVSFPLTITRKFHAPSSNTAQNFLVYCDLYEPVNEV